MGAGCTGIIQGCPVAVVDYSVQRRQFGRPPDSFQLIHDMIAEISTDRDAARLFTWRTGPALLRRGLRGESLASGKAVEAAILAIRAFGGYGYVDGYPVQKYMRDARVMTLYEGTGQIQKLLIGRAETGVSALR